MPLTTGSCHFPSTLTKPILPVLYEKLHVAAALTKWEVQCVIILQLSFPKNSEPKPSKHQRVVPAEYEMIPHPGKVMLRAESQIPIKQKISNLKRADPAQAASKQGLWAQGRIK